MFLRSLTLKGFKSFADTTSLDLEPGVTVVVGPNGSGKSNVVDAIAWVLGAQAPSAVRSQKMDDVIFAGTAKRPALGRAEVTLTIDNTAGLLPIAFTEVTISRTLFRSGDSEYAINGVPCRLLDVQEMLSDTGVGRQQHVIVSQGQIDAVLNARPEDRRAIIEEAAGVLKYRRRKEKAERRLEATEASLLRLQDLLREVRRQLKPLERQADAARRHGDLVAELGTLRLHLAGREISSLRSRLENAARDRGSLGQQETALKGELAALDTEVLTTQARLAALGGSDVSDSLVRFESMRERARGLMALLSERRRGVERDRGGLLDADLVASLEAEAAHVAHELVEVEALARALVPEADRVAQAEAALAAERATFVADGPLPEFGATPQRAGEVRGELAARRATIERTVGELARVEARLAAIEARTAQLAADAGLHRRSCEQAEEAERPLVARLQRAEGAHASAEAELALAQEEHRAADADRHVWSARVDALALALDESGRRARWRAVDGAVGALIDLVEVDDGWQGAFEAAVGEALNAVVVEGTAAARRALHALSTDGDAGAVLAVVGERPLPALSSPLRAHVRSPVPLVESLLDALLASVIVVDGGWERAMEASLARPDAVVVTPEGDRFSSSGWRIGAARSQITVAALDEARHRAAAAAERATTAASRVAAATLSVESAAHERARIESELEENDARLNAAADGLARVQAAQREVDTEAHALHAHHDALAESVSAEHSRTAELEAVLPALEADEEADVSRARSAHAARARLDEKSRAVAALRTHLEVQVAGLDERRQMLRRRRDEVEGRLEADAAERERAAARREKLERKLGVLDRLAAVLASASATIDGELAHLHEDRRRQSEESRAIAAALDDQRLRRTDAERKLEEVRERSRRAELDEAEITLRLESAIESVRNDLDKEPEAAIATECPPLPEGVTAHARVRELERELRLMGPINPLALQEFEALEERHRFLESQLDDVRSTRRDLSRVIRAIDGEIVSVFASAFADVASNFESLFSTLFPGGQGSLRLTDPEHLLDTGIEVEARPSGKNVRKLSLLSGGERSLTALAFLFAVFRSRPSPFYVMDEVEAALDDVNLHRFLDLVHEFREEAQLLIVSHQKRTMEAADCLFGVTMQPGGSSKVVSEKAALHTP
ncbi:MAG TPA: chromosome segregation protein SMC [Acidimicrobiales bacterium]|nr:chromosome segregation protein SMC [Acidimicrobiales bacterium]